MLRTFLFCVGLCALPARACEIALLLAVDVSGSVDREEYHIQMQGLADGLRDGAVSEALVAGEAAVSVVQWTGTSRQIVAIPWVRISDFETVEALARNVETSPRRWRNYSTAIGEALLFSLTQFEAVPDCNKRVIDVSGDGSSNEGVLPKDVHAKLNAAKITVNALVIEGAEPDMTGYYWENVIIGPGAFVITANNFEEYPEQMRRKLQREVTKQVSTR